MQQYIVSARKYRPATFDSVVGQRALTTTLLNAIRTEKLAHAYLFCGPRGVGKTTCARIFAKTINCQSPTAEAEACGECDSCRAFEKQNSMNIHELDAASNNSVDDIRELIEQVAIPPQGGRYKVFIIDEVHMLSAAAFNAFLKTLEEPPAYVVFIMATTEKHKILPTILSRCQVYDFQRISIQQTIDHLAYVAQKEGIEAEERALNLIAHKADGGMRDALSIFDQMVSFSGGHITYEGTLANLNELDADVYFGIVDAMLGGEVERCMLMLNDVLSRGFDGGNFIAGLAKHVRDLMVARDMQTLPLLEVSDTEKVRYQEQARRCPPRFLYHALRLANDCDNQYRTSRNKRLQVELTLIEAAQLTQPEADPSGLRPNESLKPIFTKTADEPTQPTAVSEPAPALAKPMPDHKPEGLKPQTRRTTKLTLNTVCINKTPEAAKPQETKQTDATDFYLAERGRLTEDNILRCWQQYAHSIESDERAMANRILGLTPQLGAEGEFTVAVAGTMVRDELRSRAAAIEAFFSRHIGLEGVRMNIVIAEAQQRTQALPKPQLLQHLMERNAALREMVSALEMEID